MTNKIPNSVIGAVSSVLTEYYYSHSTLNSLFMESGAPGNAPEGNCETKCSSWLRRCASRSVVNGRGLLGEHIDPPFPQCSVMGSPNTSEASGIGIAGHAGGSDEETLAAET